MVRKLGKHNIEGITMTITDNQNGQEFTISREFYLHKNCKNHPSFILTKSNTFKIIN